MLQEIVLFGKTIKTFDIVNNFGSICLVLWLLFNLKEYKGISILSQLPGTKISNNKKKSIVDWILAFIGIALITAVIFALSTPIGNRISLLFLKESGPNFFVNIFAVPLELLLIGVAFLISPLIITDIVAPGMALALIFYKLACFCLGCCKGVESEKFGMMNHLTNHMEFPVQLVEAACAVVMFIILLVVRRKKNRKPGILYPLFILMYCGSRFISEFWRGDYSNILGPLKSYHIQCIIGFVEGLILLFVVLKFGEKITEYYASKRQEILERGALFPDEDELDI